MSTTIATLAGTEGSGLGTTRHVIWGVNSARAWMFGLTGTQVLSTWWSTDLVSWTAGATHTLGAVHNSWGRSLTVAYKNISSIDTVHIGLITGVAANPNTVAIRATISGSTLTFHTTDTTLGSATTITAPNYSGGSLEFDSTNRVYFGNGFNWNTSGNAQDINAARSSADPGTAEQATAVTWTTQNIDNSPANESKSCYMVDRASGNMGMLADNGSGTTNTTALLWYTWNGTTWSASTSATGTVTAFDKDDWGAVSRTTTEHHLVYRSGATTYVHRTFSGSWGAGQSIPTQASKAGAGLAMCTDGTSIWLFVIDSDAANTVRYIKWNGTSWGTWTALETSTQTRTFLGCSPVVGGNLICVYWTESSSLVNTLLNVGGTAATRDGNGRFRLQAPATRDGKGRFSMTASTYRDAPGRTRLQAPATRDGKGRFGLAAAATATTIVPSATLGAIKGATGGSGQGHLFYAKNTGRFWFLTYKGNVDTGTATSGSTSALNDTGKAWTAGQYLGYACVITGGTGAGQWFTIGNNTATSLPVVDNGATGSWLATAIAAGSTYEIVEATRIRAWVSSSSNLGTATWAEATGSPSPSIADGTSLGLGINLAGGKNNPGGYGEFPTDGRLLASAYADVSGVDVIHAVTQQDSHYIHTTLRARITAAGTVTWDGNVHGGGGGSGWNDTAPGIEDAPDFPQGLAMGLSTTGRWWWVNEENFQSICGYAAGVTDSGAANQDPAWAGNNGGVKPTTWDSALNSIGAPWQSALAPLASGFMLAVYGSGVEDTSTPHAGNTHQAGLRYAESASATQWPTSSTAGAAVPNLSTASNHPNDWAIVGRTLTDIHLIRRNSGTVLEQVRYSGHSGSWGAKVTLPSTGLTGHLAGSGIGLVTDGTDVWCLVIDTDANHSIRYLKWTAGSATWDSSWTTLTTNTSVKDFLVAVVGASQIAVAWTQGSAAPFSVVVSSLALTGGTNIRDAAGRFSLVAPTAALRDGPGRFRLAVSALRDAPGRARLAVAALRDTAGRTRLLALGARDAAGRTRLAVLQLRDAAGRTRLLAPATRDGAGRARLQVLAWRDANGRARLAVAALRDAPGRFRLLVAGARDAAGRFRLVALGSNTRDALGRFRLQVLGSSVRDAAGRARLVASSIRDAAGRTRLAGSATRDALGRARLQVLQLRDAAGRTRLLASSTRDASGRFRLVLLGQSWRDAAGRVRIRATNWRDASGRVLLAVAGLRDARGRVLVRAPGWRDGLGRTLLLVRSTRDAAGRFRLVLGGLRDASGRIRIRATSWRDAASRTRIAVVAGRDAAGRFRLAFAGFRFANGRVQIRGLQSRDASGRFVLGILAPGPIIHGPTRVVLVGGSGTRIREV